ncbi:lysophospholipid acyltransferase family protein [Cypionkella sinensis]|uniref:Lysophospholipid acyltransferase family protein n=1 Tax=Cypionkella sinensis TaxID=1756043 RepID=A0ABV7IVR5_9RHOB
MLHSNLTRDITYATSARTRPGRALIRVLENVSGRRHLINRATGYEAEIAQGRSFWQVMPERYGLSLDITAGALSNIPKTGPLVLIANHPYGILDGLMLGHILDAMRGDFRILSNAVFRRADALSKVLLPISFDETKEATRINLQTRATALKYLGQGGAIGIFPGGTVSTSLKPFSRPMDPSWRNFTAKMIAKSNATVVPIYFEGHNSRLFQLASRIHANLRVAMLLKEFKSRTDTPVRLVIGNPIPAQTIDALKSDPTAMMETLRQATYALSPAPLPSYALGYEFEAKYKSR